MTAPKIDGAKGDNKLYFIDDETAEVTLNELANPTASAHATSHYPGGTDELLLDEDDMSTDSEDKGASQQSIKAYVDAIKTITTTITSSATPTPARASTHTVLEITALAEAAELQNPTGTPVNRDLLWVVITDDGTGRALTYDTDYQDKTGDGLPDTTTAGKELNMLFVYNGTDSAWDLISMTEEA